MIDSGEDVERHGPAPDGVVWPVPGDAARGKVAQVEKAVEVSAGEVKTWKDRPQPKLKRASPRGG